MYNKLVIIGAGGHGKVIADIAIKTGYTDIAFIDDNACDFCLGFPVVGTCADLKTYDDQKTGFIIGIGNNSTRKMVAQHYDLNWVTLIHPSAQIATGVQLGTGTVIMAGAVVNPCATIGNHCIINTSSVIEHDNVLADFVHISPNAALGGTVHVGEVTHIGIGATVKNNIEICENCVIGAGATVVKSISNAGTYIGIPAQGLNR